MVRASARTLIAICLIAGILSSSAAATDAFEAMATNWGLVWIFLLPTIVVEGFMLGRHLEIPRRTAFKASAIVNVISAMTALPATFLLVLLVTMIWPGHIFGTFSWGNGLGGILGSFSQSPGTPSYVPDSWGEIVAQSAMVGLLLVFMCVIEFGVLRLLVRGQETMRVATAALEANAVTTVFFIGLPAISIAKMGGF